jgi:hypothetical protein
MLCFAPFGILLLSFQQLDFNATGEMNSNLSVRLSIRQKETPKQYHWYLGGSARILPLSEGSGAAGTAVARHSIGWRPHGPSEREPQQVAGV